MIKNILAENYLKELNAEVPASRKCLERISEKTFDWKPHEKSMNMGYLALLVADMPRWITHTIEKGEIDLATYDQQKFKTASDLVNIFDKNVQDVNKALNNLTDDILAKTFYLKSQGQLLYSSPVNDTISSTINHWVHHRGQLTVYMRLNNIPVPSIYGPSADERTF